jgi:hypothetical protein
MSTQSFVERNCVNQLQLPETENRMPTAMMTLWRAKKEEGIARLRVQPRIDNDVLQLHCCSQWR